MAAMRKPKMSRSYAPDFPERHTCHFTSVADGSLTKICLKWFKHHKKAHGRLYFKTLILCSYCNLSWTYRARSRIQQWQNQAREVWNNGFGVPTDIHRVDINFVPTTIDWVSAGQRQSDWRSVHLWTSSPLRWMREKLPLFMCLRPLATDSEP